MSGMRKADRYSGCPLADRTFLGLSGRDTTIVGLVGLALLTLMASGPASRRADGNAPKVPTTLFEGKLEAMLLSLDEPEQTKTRLGLNQFYQQRIETIRTRLWTTLAWLAVAIGAGLVLSVKEGGVRTSQLEGGPVRLMIEQPLLVVMLSVLGAVLALYMRGVVLDGWEHLRSNRRNSNLALGLPENPGEDAKKGCLARVWSLTWLKWMGVLASLALLLEMALTAVGIIGTMVWLGWVGDRFIKIPPREPPRQAEPLQPADRSGTGPGHPGGAGHDRAAPPGSGGTGAHRAAGRHR
jgi:hypothetical protein